MLSIPDRQVQVAGDYGQLCRTHGARNHDTRNLVAVDDVPGPRRGGRARPAQVDACFGLLLHADTHSTSVSNFIGRMILRVFPGGIVRLSCWVLILTIRVRHLISPRWHWKRCNRLTDQLTGTASASQPDLQRDGHSLRPLLLLL